MIYNLSNPYEREKLIAWVERMIEKGEVIEAKRKDVARTIKQNSYLSLRLLQPLDVGRLILQWMCF